MHPPFQDERLKSDSQRGYWSYGHWRGAPCPDFCGLKHWSPFIKGLLGRGDMTGDLAVVFDVAGTLLRMYRVAKDLVSSRLIENVVTSELIMEKSSRALVVPQIDPSELELLPPDMPLHSFIQGREDLVNISCYSTPVSREVALDILRSSDARMADIQEAHNAVRSRCPDAYETAGLIVDAELCQVSYTISTGGRPFRGLSEVIRKLEEMGADIYVASGDSMGSLSRLTSLGISLDRIYPVSTPSRKSELVTGLKGAYCKVVMVGDGLNDLLALKAADLGVLTIQQDSHPSSLLINASDRIISDITDLPQLLKEDAILLTNGYCCAQNRDAGKDHIL
jgi:soluble P-type ATPase